MTISDEAVTKIVHILKLTRTMELDELLILSNSVIEQTRIKSKLKGPQEIIFMNLSNRFKRRIREGYLPEEAKERIAVQIRGE